MEGLVKRETVAHLPMVMERYPRHYLAMEAALLDPKQEPCPQVWQSEPQQPRSYSGMRNRGLQSVFGQPSIPDRLEYLQMVEGIQFVNDAASSKPNSTWFTLEEIRHPIIWITTMGECDSSILDSVVAAKVRVIICIGNAMPVHKRFSRWVDIIHTSDCLFSAVHTSLHYARNGDNVVLSPCSKPLYPYTSAAQLGRAFRSIVNNL